MKTTFLKQSFCAMFLVVGIVACNNSPEKKAELVEEQRQDLNEAKVDLHKAIQDSIADYNSFKTEAEEKIKAYDNKIAELKLTVQLEKNPLRASQEKAINEYTLKSSRLKASIAEYNEAGQNNWDEFKRRFNYELDDLGKSISTLSKNVEK